MHRRLSFIKCGHARLSAVVDCLPVLIIRKGKLKMCEYCWGDTPGSPYHDERDDEEMKPCEMSIEELLLAMVEMDTMSKEASDRRKELKNSIIPFMTEQEQYKVMLSILQEDETIMNARKGFNELIEEAKTRRELLRDKIRRGEITLREGTV
jgi:hypothetical protein